MQRKLDVNWNQYDKKNAIVLKQVLRKAMIGDQRAIRHIGRTYEQTKKFKVVA